MQLGQVNECYGDFATIIAPVVISRTAADAVSRSIIRSMSMSSRLAIACTPLLVWALLYLASRVAGILPTRFLPWLRTGWFALMVVSLISFIGDHDRLANILLIHAGGLSGAELWIRRHHKLNFEQRDENLVTSLKL
jgi:hypothetical protein